MKLLYSILFIALVVPVLAQAQQEPQGQSTAPAQSFTLDQCIQYALENNNNVRNAIVDQDIAIAKVRETRGMGLPQIDGSVNLQHNIQLQRFFNYAGVVQGFTGQKIDVDSTEIVAAKSPFQLKNVGLATINASQILFSGSYIVGLKAANAYKDLSVKATRQTKEEIVSQVTKAFYTALINSERIKLYENNISRVDSLLRTTEALNKNGFAEAIDVDRIRVTLNNLNTERINFSNLQVLSIELLKFQMNFPMENAIQISGTIEEIMIPENGNPEEDWDYTRRPDYQVLQANKRLQELNIKNAYAAGLPMLVATGSLGYSTQSASIMGLFKTETPTKGVTFPTGVGPDKWYQYSSIGVNLTVPLFSGLQRTYRIQQARLSLQKIQNNEQLLKSSINLQVKQYSTTYDNSLKTLISQRENMQLADKVARVTKIKYEQGVGSNIEVIDAETSLKESQINYYNALYNALVAKVDLDRAYGKLLPPTSN